MPSDERGCVHGQQKVCADCVSDQRRGEGESVATYWARILHECEVTGEPIEIANKFGDVVAVMVSKDAWDEMQRDMRELFDRRAGVLGA